MMVSVPESLNLELHRCNFENLDFAIFFLISDFHNGFNIWTLQTILRNTEFCRTNV